jgi:hypothetical protein
VCAGAILGIIAIVGLPPLVLPYGGIAILIVLAIVLAVYEVRKTMLYWRDLRGK